MKNRKIKFRIWNKSNWMDYFPSAIEDLNLGIKKDQEEGIIYMQYTGLKDKNNKEIFEGDIIEYSNERGQTIKNEVTFSQGCFGAGIQLLWDLDDINIIGTIYENPDLLT